MAVVVTVDEQRSRKAGGTRAPELSRSLNADAEIRTILPFEVTVGDELQGVLYDSKPLVAVLRGIARTGRWWVGIGFGSIDFVGSSARTSTGSAFLHARQAVDRAKKLPWGVAVEGDESPLVRNLHGAIALWMTILQMRSARGWETVDLRRRALSEAEIADRLGVTQQAVNQRLRAALYGQDEEGASLIDSIGAAIPAEVQAQ